MGDLDITYSTEQEKEINLELEFLSSVSIALTQTNTPDEVIEALQTSFHKLINVEKLNVFIYDDNTNSLKDYAKSWVIIDEVYDKEYTKKLYSFIKTLGYNDFLINDNIINIDSFGDINSYIKSRQNIILYPLMQGDSPYGLIELVINLSISDVLSLNFFKALVIAAYQISLKIQNKVLTDKMQAHVDFQESMKNIAKIIETQYELNYIIPLIGEMIDKFITDHLVYIFLKNDNDFELVWPSACRDPKIKEMIKQLDAASGYVLTENDKLGLFPLVSEGKILGCIVAHSHVDKLTKKEIEYLDQLTKQSSATIQRANMYAETLQHATLDALTGLNNRRQFETRLRQEVSSAKRQKKPLCAAMVDVDFFKKVNDSYGHAVGDEVLKNIANVIKTQLRESDIASRYGGEEFAILLPFTKIEEAGLVAQRLRMAVEKKVIDLSGVKDAKIKEISVTISVGVYQFNENDAPEQLYTKADKALYYAKEHGRNKVIVNKG